MNLKNSWCFSKDAVALQVACTVDLQFACWILIWILLRYVEIKMCVKVFGRGNIRTVCRMMMYENGIIDGCVVMFLMGRFCWNDSLQFISRGCFVVWLMNGVDGMIRCNSSSICSVHIRFSCLHNWMTSEFWWWWRTSVNERRWIMQLRLNNCLSKQQCKV